MLYFALVFGAGFLLGALRVLWVAPRLGIRAAELLEEPLMLLVTILAARWVVRTLALPFSTPGRLVMGFVALLFLLVAEFGLAYGLRGLSPAEYVAGQDPVSGTVYYLLLLLFALMPLWVQRRKDR